jgi:hypothetical protein
MSVDVEITFTRVYRLFYFPFIIQKPAVGWFKNVPDIWDALVWAGVNSRPSEAAECWPGYNLSACQEVFCSASVQLPCYPVVVERNVGIHPGIVGQCAVLTPRNYPSQETTAMERPATVALWKHTPTLTVSSHSRNKTLLNIFFTCFRTSCMAQSGIVNCKLLKMMLRVCGPRSNLLLKD